jgi:cytochrome c oxidase subunit 3
MSTTLVPPEIEKTPGMDRGGRDYFNTGDPGGGDPGGGGFPLRYDPYQTAVWVFLIPVVMFFVGLTSSMIVRSGASGDWVAVKIPGVAVLSTLVLLASSFTCEMARRGSRRADPGSLGLWLWATCTLGLLFLVGQWMTWKALTASGVFVATNPGSAFFYLLTASHGAHLLGALAALLYLAIRELRRELTSKRRSALRAAAVFWHFMDGLWLYLLTLLVVWR